VSAPSVYDAPTWSATLPEPRRLAKNGYVAYADYDHGCPSNAAATRPGYGRTPTEAIQSSTYWANQLPWVLVVRFDRAPRWAREQGVVES
jgi:hypothetical protein